jgi:hypothetical protein
LLRAIAKLAQQSPYPDLITCWVMLDLERLIDRLKASQIAGLSQILECSEQTFDTVKSKAIEKLGNSLPLKVEATELELRRPHAEMLLPLPDMPPDPEYTPV